MNLKRLCLLVIPAFCLSLPLVADNASPLTVVIGCGDLDIVDDLLRNNTRVVQMLDTDMNRILKAREYYQQKGIYGRVTARMYDGRNLPYVNNLVNSVVVSGDKMQPAALSQKSEEADGVTSEEIVRVLAPQGTLLVKGSSNISHSSLRLLPCSASKGGQVAIRKPPQKLSGWQMYQKNIPADIDDWSHWMHAADGNAVASDKQVGVPRHLQWMQDPVWISSHNLNPGVSAMVTAGGKLFSIINEMPPGVGGMDDQWVLSARDAFNGLVLWEKPINDWGWKHWSEFECKVNMRFVPPFQLMRRLVASDDMLFVTPGFFSPVHVLDPATGKEIRVLKGTEKTSEIIFDDGVLFLSVNDSLGSENMIPNISIMAVDPAKGKTLWKTEGFRGVSGKLNSLYKHANTFLSSGRGEVFFLNEDEVVCLSKSDGKTLWRAARPGNRLKLTDEDINSLLLKRRTSSNVPSYRASQYLPNNCAILHSDGVVLLSEIKDEKANFNTAQMKTAYTVAYEAKSGKELWRFDAVTFAHFVPPDLFVINGLVWTLDGKDRAYVGLDLKTGEKKKSYPMGKMIWQQVGHQLCFRNKATTEMLVFGRWKTEFVDIHTGEVSRHAWTRGMCVYGVMPANGMIYYPPHNCSCLMPFKLTGFRAQTAHGYNGETALPRLVKGSAYGKPSSGAGEGSSEWPMYRGSPERKGSISVKLSDKPKLKWSVDIGGALSQVIAVKDSLFTAEKDLHRVVCLSRADGKFKWRFSASGRIDSAPTYSNGRIVAGCRDGYVYCLNAENGALAWKFRAAPHDANIIAFSQLESAWPVHGSLIVRDDKVYCLAGRSSNLNGGMYLYVLHLKTGEAIQEKRLVLEKASTYEKHESLLADLLTVDGTNMYMRTISFPADDISRIQYSKAATHGPTKGSPTAIRPTSGFLDTSWFNTTVWGIGSMMGQIMAYDDKNAFGLLATKVFRNSYKHDVFNVGKSGYKLFCREMTNEPAPAEKRRGKGKQAAGDQWAVMVPVRGNSMLVSSDAVYLAGTRDIVDSNDPWGHVEGRKGAVLNVYSRNDGKKLSEQTLGAAPIFDGLSASGNNIYLVTEDGKINCYE